MAKLKTGDKVLIITGQHKGQSAKITSFCKKSQRVIVKDLNICKKHTKANPSKDLKAGIYEKEKPIHISNLKKIS